MRPWERQSRESAQAFEAFSTYLELGADRSLAEVGRRLGKSKALMDRWSSRWRWVERVYDWDLHLDRKKRTAQAAEAEKMGKRQAQQAEAMQQVLTMPVLAVQKKLAGGDRDAVLGELQSLPLGALIDMVRQCSMTYPHVVRVERLARGEPDELIEARHHVEGQVKSEPSVSLKEVIAMYAEAAEDAIRKSQAPGAPGEDGAGESVDPDAANPPAG